MALFIDYPGRVADCLQSAAASPSFMVGPAFIALNTIMPHLYPITISSQLKTLTPYSIFGIDLREQGMGRGRVWGKGPFSCANYNF